MEYSILNTIKSPADLKKLGDGEISVLADEIRDKILKTVSENGGHLSSNLGVVELTIALHRVYNAPEDSIIFDVGHQCYTHKLLTGRFDKFDTLRKENGISGFLRPAESEYDPVVSGHSSTSVSSAFGIHKGNQIQGKDRKTVAVIGDGALTGGMVYEALNNVGRDKGNLVIVLNDNTMSISKNVGALARHLNIIRTKPGYFKFKMSVKKFLIAIPIIGRRLNSRLMRSKNALKNALYNSNIFDGFGLYYLGPVDGHDEKKLENMLRIAKDYSRPTILHVITTKGKGYPYAQEDPAHFHGVSPFDLNDGSLTDKINFSSVFGKALCELAKNDDKICAVTAAMESGTGLEEFALKFKNRFFDVGIAEEHAVTFSAGLAKSGMKPFFAVYSAFLQRAYDQLVHDAAIDQLPLTVCVDRAGIVGEDGETHNGLLDPAFLSSVPSVSVFAPACYNELRHVLKDASERKNGLWAIRYPRGDEPKIISECDYFQSPYTHFPGGNVLIVTYGTLFAEAYSLKKEMPNLGILKLNRIQPIDCEAVVIAAEYSDVLFFEEGIRDGGVAQKFGSALCESGFKGKYKITAVDGFVPQGKTADIKHKLGLDRDGMLSEVRNCLKN